MALVMASHSTCKHIIIIGITSKPSIDDDDDEQDDEHGDGVVAYSISLGDDARDQTF